MDKKENEILTVDVCMKYIAAKNVFTSRRHHTKPNHSDILVKTSYTQLTKLSWHSTRSQRFTDRLLQTRHHGLKYFKLITMFAVKFLEYWWDPPFCMALR